MNTLDNDDFNQFKQKTIDKMCKLQYENMLLTNKLEQLSKMLNFYDTGYNVLCNRVDNIARITHRITKRQRKETA